MLEVDRERHVGRDRDRGDVRDHLVQARVSVLAPEREGKARAGARQRGEAEPLQHPGRPDIPRVRDDEWIALVHGAEALALLVLVHGM